MTSVVIKPVPGRSASAVGELFSHHGSIPIFLDGPPGEVLHEDVARILRHLGYEVRSEAEPTGNVVEIGMTGLDVRSEPGGWLDLKGITRAKVSFAVVYRRATGEELWAEEFTGSHEIKVAYFFLKDAEATLGQAYCRALEAFAGALRGANGEDPPQLPAHASPTPSPSRSD